MGLLNFVRQGTREKKATLKEGPQVYMVFPQSLAEGLALEAQDET